MFQPYEISLTQCLFSVYAYIILWMRAITIYHNTLFEKQVCLQFTFGPSEILPQALEDAGQGVGSRTGGGKIRFTLFCQGSGRL